MTEQYLRKLYYDLDSNTAYTSESQLWKQIKRDKKQITREELNSWLAEQNTYTLHKQYSKLRIYRKTRVNGTDEQWQADLVDMKEFSEINDDYNYLLTVIDCFSRYAWIKPLRTKTGQETSKAFEEIFLEGRIPTKIQFDEGKEFYNNNVKQLLSSKNIAYFSTFSDKKAAIIERFNRSIKSRMYKYFTEQETRKWIDVIQKLVDGYNNSYHYTIKMTPLEASKKENSETVWWNIYGAYITAATGLPAYKIGQTVRISKYKSIFGKGYLPNFTEEYFKIKQIIVGNPVVYKLQDLKDEDLNGIFYEEELSEYNPGKDVEYKIEKILGRKTVKGKKYALVKYKGWPDKFNDWLPINDLKKFT